MERYSCFSGLTNLRAINLKKSNALLPKKGRIGDHVKSGDHLNCELTSTDIWLQVHIECIEARLMIQFELKIARSILLEALAEILTQLANEVLIAKGSFIQYQDTEIVLKIDSKEPESSLKVSDTFDYISRSLDCVLTKQSDSSSVLSSSSSNSIPNMMDFDYQLPETHPIRYLKVEPRVTKNTDEYLQEKTQDKENTQTQVCGCSIF